MTAETQLGTYVVLPETSQQVQVALDTANRLLGVLRNWKLQTPEDVTKAGELLTGAHTRWKQLEELRKTVTPEEIAQAREALRPKSKKVTKEKVTTAVPT